VDNVRDTLFNRVADCVSLFRSSRSITLGGTQASELNIEIFSRCLNDWLILLEDLMLRLNLQESSRDAKRNNFVQALLPADLSEVLLFLDAVYTRLIDECDTPDSFKHYLEGRANGIDYQRLLSPISQVTYQFLIEIDQEKKAYFLSIIAQFLRFARKLEFQDIGLEQKALADYMETEDELESMSYDDEQVFDKLANIVHRWFKDFHIDILLPKHGSGSVSEGSLTLAQKYAHCHTDVLIRECLSDIGAPDSYLDYFPVQPGEALVRRSRTIFVPKTAVKLRTISMEPCTLQYLQQGVMYELYRYIENHEYLGVRVRLADQQQNQIMAWEGSKYCTFGTIDLSHASDSVSWNLVRRVFRKSSSLFKWLMVTRSKETLLPNGEVIKLNKFAPMGSALCFPVECILFAAIVEYATNKICRQLKIRKEIYTVYGDDIVVQAACYDETCRILQLCGFTVNTSKSYNSGPYRESCGKEYYAGVDISAIYYRIPFSNRKTSPSVYSSWCSMANNAYLHRLPVLRNYLINRVLSTFPGKGPYFGRSPYKSPYLYSPQPTNFHVVKKWCKRYQRWEGRFISVKSKLRGAEVTDDVIRYHCALVNMAKRCKLHAAPIDEFVPSVSLQGCVEFFSSTALPITDWIQHDLMLTEDL